MSEHKNPIDPLAHADSVLALLGSLNVEKFPGEERIAVATLQVEALDDWLAADMQSIGVGHPDAPSRSVAAAEEGDTPVDRAELFHAAG